SSKPKNEFLMHWRSPSQSACALVTSESAAPLRAGTQKFGVCWNTVRCLASRAIAHWWPTGCLPHRSPSGDRPRHLIGADCLEVGVLIERDLDDALTELNAQASTQPRDVEGSARSQRPRQPEGLTGRAARPRLDDGPITEAVVPE